MIREILGLLWTVLMIIVVLVLAYLFTRYVVGRTTYGPVRQIGRRIIVLEKVMIGKDQKLLLVKLGDAYYFLGAGQDSITCLREVPEDEVAQWKLEDKETPPKMGFQEALHQVIEQRKNKGGR